METLGNGMKHLKFWKHLNSYIQTTQHPALDPTTPWFEWCSYLECCHSLGVNPSLGRFMRYNQYYRSVFDK